MPGLPTTIVPYIAETSIEIQFANALKDYQLNTLNVQSDLKPQPFDFINKFKQIAASQALQFGTELYESENENDIELKENFENWDLETKLWHLVEQLYSFRLLNYSQEEPDIINDKQILVIKELLIIINWIQSNSKSESYDDSFEKIQQSSKWSNTKVSINQQDYNALINKSNTQLIDNLDIDAPLRTKKSIDAKDNEIDIINFARIYKLILRGKLQEAIDYSNNTGNFALALILVGAAQNYMDPSLEKNHGMKHKLLWKETVYKLSQQSGLNYYEKLIYNYLSGGDISENLKFSNDSWEESLLLYCTQLLSYKLDFIYKNNESLSISLPKPQVSNIDEILNLLQNNVSHESLHPTRIITGAILIDKVNELLNFDFNEQINENILRILVHLSIFLAILFPFKISSHLTNILTLYITKLSEDNKSELIPIYLSFIPNEKDAREAYSIILSSITNKEERIKHLEISKKLNKLIDDNDDMIIENNDKMINVLRRTVERVMNETEEYYKPKEEIRLQDELNESIDPIDYKLSRAVDWFFENQMHSDSIKASIILIRRFLIMGKLTSLKHFVSDKNFNQLIIDYNVEALNHELDDQVTEDMKSELLDYSLFTEGLKLIYDWKSFKINGDSYNSSSVEKSLEKTEKNLKNLIFTWLIDLSKNVDDPIFKEFRSI
ncbi:unnamed protein product [Candida verbasci]|uniref:Nuclear pore complex protein n=1 Tax=Candida verbasci TaxID=1227364 RepID=A0A9W4TY00_9ASCO|nr:unnamed protein product [Candida verbasci]